MATLFVEYRLKPEHQEEHLQAVRALMRANANLQVLESADEPGLYVELWQSPDSTRLNHGSPRLNHSSTGLARARTEQLAPVAEGGAARVRCWTFNNIDQNG